MSKENQEYMPPPPGGPSPGKFFFHLNTIEFYLDLTFISKSSVNSSCLNYCKTISVMLEELTTNFSSSYICTLKSFNSTYNSKIILL